MKTLFLALLLLAPTMSHADETEIDVNPQSFHRSSALDAAILQQEAQVNSLYGLREQTLQKQLSELDGKIQFQKNLIKDGAQEEAVYELLRLKRLRKAELDAYGATERGLKLKQAVSILNELNDRKPYLVSRNKAFVIGGAAILGTALLYDQFSAGSGEEISSREFQIKNAPHLVGRQLPPKAINTNLTAQ